MARGLDRYSYLTWTFCRRRRLRSHRITDALHRMCHKELLLSLVGFDFPEHIQHKFNFVVGRLAIGWITFHSTRLRVIRYIKARVFQMGHYCKVACPCGIHHLWLFSADSSFMHGHAAICRKHVPYMYMDWYKYTLKEQWLNRRSREVYATQTPNRPKPRSLILRCAQ